MRSNTHVSIVQYPIIIWDYNVMTQRELEVVLTTVEVVVILIYRDTDCTYLTYAPLYNIFDQLLRIVEYTTTLSL